MKKIYIVGSISFIAVFVGIFFLVGSHDDPAKKNPDSSTADSVKAKSEAKKKESYPQNNAGLVKKSVDSKNKTNTKNKSKIVFKKSKKRFKPKKSLFPKGRIKNFPWRKGRPVLAKNLKPSKGKMPSKFDYQNEYNPNWESSFREGLSKEFEGQKINTDKKNSIIISNGNKAFFAEEVGVRIGEDSNEVRMIVNSEDGSVIHKFPNNENPSDSGSGSGEMKNPTSGGGSNASNTNETDSDNLWGNYSGFHYAKDSDLKSLEEKKEDEQSVSPRVEMTEEEKEAYQKSLEK